MIATVVSVEGAFTRNGDEFKKVTVADGQGKQTTKSVFNNLEDKWPLLVEGATLEFKMEKKGQFWNTVDVLSVGDQLPPPQSPHKVLPQHKGEIEKAVNEIEAEYFDQTRDRDGLPLSVKLRTFSFSYCKDLACEAIKAGKSKTIDEIIEASKRVEKYIQLGD